MEQITVLPWETGDESERVRFEVGEAVPAPEKLEGELKKVRGFYVLPQMLREFGYTQGCAQCNHTVVHGKGKEGIPHIPQCRARIMKAMKESTDPKHNELVSRYEAKMNSALDTIMRK